MTQESKQKQFQVHNHVGNSYKTRKSTLLRIGNSEEKLDLSRIYLAVQWPILVTSGGTDYSDHIFLSLIDLKMFRWAYNGVTFFCAASLC